MRKSVLMVSSQKLNGFISKTVGKDWVVYNANFSKDQQFIAERQMGVIVLTWLAAGLFTILLSLLL